MLGKKIVRPRAAEFVKWALAAMLVGSSWCARAADWFAMGPYGGDVRSLAADPQNPKHVYLGTGTGWVYDSTDGGANWKRLARLSRTEDLVISRILIDPSSPKRLLIGTYRFDRPDGGVFISNDGGKTWYEQAQMRGQSVRSMARSVSDPQEVAAGTLQGVFLSKDNGTHWNQISPAGSTELHEVESLAIDPTDPSVIYAGTWHLPWKTADGGATWTNIKQGIIDDSDVFSIIIDPTHPQTVYASACSGIYKSLSGGDKFVKINGIPSTARRTRKLLQDPTAPEIVFAGTTEGLYRTKNAGENFKLTTGPELVINDVYVDSSNPQHVLLATDRGGVLSSEDGGDSFQPSNTGFSAQQVQAYTADLHHPGTIYVGLVNGKATGGVFRSLDGGVQWEQQSDGLSGRDVWSLATTPEGTMLAGTGHGVFRLQDGTWIDSNAMDAPILTDPAGTTPASAEPTETLTLEPKTEPAPAVIRKPSVSASSRTGTVKPVHTTGKRKPAAATRAKGKKNEQKPGLRRVAAKSGSRKAVAPQRTRARTLPPLPPPPLLAAPVVPHLDAIVYGMLPQAGSVYAATSAGLVRSDDDGLKWVTVDLTMPDVHFVAGQKTMVLAGGLRRLALSMDGGKKWDTLALPADLTQLSAMAVDELGNLWVGGSEGVFYSTDYGMTWKTLRNLFTTAVDGIYFDAASHRVLVTTSNATIVYAAHLPDYKVSFWETGWPLRFVRPVGDHLIGATLFDGMVLQPRMVAPQEKAAAQSTQTVEAAQP